jgi:PIN domain nuclease of toxin-antitoxin system
MDYLLDTHTLIWLAEEPDKLSSKAKIILHSENKLLLSSVSVWEMAIKIKANKLNVEIPLKDFVNKAIEKHELKLLSVSLPHIYYTQQLELHHKDPFDRLLIAQSFEQNIPIISSDEIFDLYKVNRIW